ncbi:MAG: DoxX family protein [Acidimicrobiales bacterium]
MSPSRSLARPMLSGAFVVEGINTLRDPRPRVEASEDEADTVGVVADPDLGVKVISGIQVGAGMLLAVGKFRRLSTVALIGSTIPTVYSGQRFWEVDDPQERGQQLVRFSKNVGLIGGLILELVDTEGAPSLRWRARRAAKHAGSVSSGGSHAENAKTGELTERAGRQAAKAAAVALAGAPTRRPGSLRSRP